MTISDTDASVRQARQVLVARRREVAEDLRRLDQAIAALDMVLPDAPTRERAPRPQRGGGRRSVLRPAILEVLRERGTLHADDIVTAIRERGIELSAVDPKASVVNALLRMAQADEVKALGGNRYELPTRTDRDVSVANDIARVAVGMLGSHIVSEAKQPEFPIDNHRADDAVLAGAPSRELP